MKQTVWLRRPKGRPSLPSNAVVDDLYPSRDEANRVGTADAHLYDDPRPVERDVVFIVWQQDMGDDRAIAAVSETLAAAQTYIAEHPGQWIDYDIEVHELLPRQESSGPARIVADTLRTLMGATAAEPYIRAIEKALDGGLT